MTKMTEENQIPISATKQKELDEILGVVPVSTRIMLETHKELLSISIAQGKPIQAIIRHLIENFVRFNKIDAL